MRLHQIAGSRKARVLVELYAKLIGLILFHFLTMPLRTRELNLSPTKAFRRVAKKSGNWLMRFIFCEGSIRSLVTSMRGS